MTEHELDLTRIPRGQIGWSTLINALAETDDRAERYFLELKSELDLSAKEHQAKVAKFILGSANRSRERALRRFEGYGLLVIGVATGSIVGIAPFEMKDLERAVTKYVGSDGPGWDLERIPVEGGKDVIAIVVDPPIETTVFTCRSDGPEKLRDGAIYIRADGETREAKGSEVRDLIARTRVASKPQVQLSVDIIGDIPRYSWQSELFDAYVNRVTDRLVSASDGPRQSRSGPYGVSSSFGEMPERRTVDQYQREIQEWRESTLAAGGEVVVRRLVGAQGPRNAVRIQNLSDRFLEEVEIEIQLSGCTAVEALDTSENPLEELPECPRLWGPYVKSIGPYFGIGSRNSMPNSSDSYGLVTFVNDHEANSVGLTLSLKVLRPASRYTSDDDDFALFVVGVDAGALTGSWSATAKGIDEVFRGELSVPLSAEREITPFVEAAFQLGESNM